MKATLTNAQIASVWNYAEQIDGQDSSKIRQDFLGAEIHFEEYETNSPFGWCAEYILSPDILTENGISCANVFCEANLRVLFIGNYEANMNNPIGHYKSEYKRIVNANRHQVIKQVSDISEFGKDELRRLLNISEETLERLLTTKK